MRLLGGAERGPHMRTSLDRCEQAPAPGNCPNCTTTALNLEVATCVPELLRPFLALKSRKGDVGFRVDLWPNVPVLIKSRPLESLISRKMRSPFLPFSFPGNEKGIINIFSWSGDESEAGNSRGRCPEDAEMLLYFPFFPPFAGLESVLLLKCFF